MVIELDERGWPRDWRTVVRAANVEAYDMVDRNDINLGGRLGEWQCHKRVRAAKILAIGRFNVSPDDMLLDLMGSGDLLDEGATWVSAKPNMFARYRPVPGDYYVVYDYDTPDEYHSISPAAAFEKGYALIAGEVG